MKTIHPNLINFPAFKFAGLFSNNVIISKTGIIHTTRTSCCICESVCKYNGSSNKGNHILSKSSNTFFRKGQQYCSVCDKTIQVENQWLDELIDSLNQYIVSQTLSLSEQLSEEEIVEHLNRTMSIKISKSTIHKIITASNEEFEKIEFDYEIMDNFYGYDEQFLKIDGKRAYRLVFFDLKENKIIYEKIHYKFSKKILKEVLGEVFGDKMPKGFVVDMRLEYPNAFKDVFGKKIRLQFCVFHLNKLILKEYQESLKVGKKIKWTLMDYYNMYSLFNIFYNRNLELKRLKKLMENFKQFKANLTNEKVKFYVNKYKVNYKTFERQKQEVIEIMEKKLMKSFRRILHDKKNLRKRRKETLLVRSIESAKKIFAKIQQEKSIFSKKIQKRIERIEKNFEFFIASEGEVLTNNKLEGFFGATLKKFRKKSRKSLVAFSALLKRKRAKQEGMEFFRKFNVFDIAQIFAALSLFGS
ncbi:MAG: hypothetical protein ABIH82_00960 [Candidatus Woesearchaeota archaeon]